MAEEPERPEIQEKNKIIQEKDKIIQEKDNFIQEKDNFIQEKDNFIRQKDDLIQQKDNMIQENFKKIQEKDKIIQEKSDKIQEIVKEMDTKIQEIVKEMDTKIQEKDKKIQDLEIDNDKFKNEASKYQYALGAATSFRLSDDDKNNSVKFKEDILNLQHSLENYVTKCKGSVDINIPEVQNLLKTYNSETDITKDQKKHLIRVVIQRHVIQQIFEYAEEYFKDFTQHKFKVGMETFMHQKAKELTELAESFAEKRDGDDDTTRVFPVKLRQQIFAALGNRGFNNVVVKSKNLNFTHEFISKYQGILNNEIEKYRKLKDPEKRQEVVDMAGDIIRKVVTLFWFRLKVQEPIAEYCWFNYKDKIDPKCMEGIWDDDEIDNIAVDICYFPLISNKSTRQIYTPAKIFHIHKEEV